MASNVAKNFGFIVLMMALQSWTLKQVSAWDKAWQTELELSTSCFVNAGASNDLTATSDDEGKSKTQSDSIREQVAWVADRIETGIASSTFATGSIATNAVGCADLSVVVANALDDQLSKGDRYWNYYQDCDRWGISFGATACFSRVYSTTSESSVSWTLKRYLESKFDLLRRLEFQFCEKLDQFPRYLLIDRESELKVESVAKGPFAASNHRIICELIFRNLEGRIWFRLICQMHEWGHDKISSISSNLNAVTDRLLTATREFVSYQSTSNPFKLIKFSENPR